MSSTRKSEDASAFHQSRYASAPEFERGMIGNLVAKRCALLTDKADRELIWFIQYLSHQEGGMAAVARDLVRKYPERLGTKEMVEIGKGSTQKYNASEVRQVRDSIPTELRSAFPLKGETVTELNKSTRSGRVAKLAQIAVELRELADEGMYRSRLAAENQNRERSALGSQEQADAQKYPTAYPVSVFQDLFRQAAERGCFDNGTTTNNLEKELFRLCLDPGFDLNDGAPWYFSELVDVLREFQRQWVAGKSGVVVTTLGQKIYDTLDFTLHSRSLALLEGNARLGKSFAARAWCEQHPGSARFVEVPPSNDDASFFRALARGLGIGNFLKYKVAEIRERVESVLLTGDILLVLDEAQRLWPQRNLRRGFPGRVVWVMTMTNAGVPVCMVSTPQFIQTQKALERNGWNSAQLTGRLGHYEFLPTQLQPSDLMAVGRAVLPETSEEVLKVLAIYARTSDRYLAAVDSIAKRAHYIAQRAGRSSCSTEDVRTAMKESVIPSDTMLLSTLGQGNKSTPGRRSVPPDSPQADSESAPRDIKPLAAELASRARISRRAAGVAVLVTES